ncbi:MAG: ankyrin repeat protein 50-like [Verrucomicrobiaceae bacterium]|nr:ankyrin repeat protein 50-like [Verrucomicrobiaceae bacterium]
MKRIFFNVVLTSCAIAHSALVWSADVDQSTAYSFDVCETAKPKAVIAATRKLFANAREKCAYEAKRPYIESLFVGPAADSFRDGVSLSFKCLPGDDVQLSQIGRDASQPDAGAGLWSYAARTLISPIPGWDLSYKHAFDQSKVSERDTMRKFFRDSAVGAEYARHYVVDASLFKNVPAKVDAAVLIDFQAFYYFGHRIVQFSYADNTRSESRSWNTRNSRIEAVPLEAELLRRQAQVLMDYKLSPPPEVRPYPLNGANSQFVFSGYVGVVSVYLDGKIRQFPIVADDIIETASSKGAPGRLIRTLQLQHITAEEREKATRSEEARERGLSLLKAARKADIGEVQRLIRAGADLNQEIDGSTPLIEATTTDSSKVVQLMLQAGANANFITVSGESALNRAAGRGSLSNIQMLIQGGAKASVGSMSTAIRWGHFDILKILFEQGGASEFISSSDLTSLLFQSLEANSNLDIVSYVIAKGGDVNAIQDGKTPLMKVATGMGMMEKLMAQHEGEKILGALIDAGANINFASADCWTALLWARHMNKKQIENLLLKMGASADVEQYCHSERSGDRA